MNLVGHIEYVACIILQSIKMEKTYREQITETINNLCEKHDLKQPITVPSAGKMIMEYEGLDRAIELFEGAVEETTDIFKKSAYRATLEIILLPMK
jgi:hypothetical protein